MCNLQTVLSFPLGKVSLYLSSPPLWVALNLQPKNLQDTLLHKGLHRPPYGSPHGSALILQLTMRKSAGQRPHYNGEVQKEQIGHASPAAIPTQGGHMSTRLGAQANKAFPGAPSTPGQRGWRRASLGPLLKGLPPGNMPTPSSEAQLRETEGSREERGECVRHLKSFRKH